MDKRPLRQFSWVANRYIQHRIVYHVDDSYLVLDNILRSSNCFRRCLHKARRTYLLLKNLGNTLSLTVIATVC